MVRSIVMSADTPRSPQASGADPERLLERPPDLRLPGRNRTKAEILVYRLADRPLALKDYSSQPLLLRQTLGRWLCRREAAAYRAARDVAGLPRCLGRVGRFALALEWIDGARTLAEIGSGAVDPAVFERLERVVQRLHERGVALGDLHHRDVLVSAGSAVHVVDLATAWVLGPRPGVLRRRAFRRLCERDRIATARLRARYTGGDPEAAIDAIGGRAAARYRRGRRLKRLWNRLRGRQ
jgi:hypothetical protein